MVNIPQYNLSLKGRPSRVELCWSGHMLVYLIEQVLSENLFSHSAERCHQGRIFRNKDEILNSDFCSYLSSGFGVEQETEELHIDNFKPNSKNLMVQQPRHDNEATRMGTNQMQLSW